MKESKFLILASGKNEKLIIVGDQNYKVRAFMGMRIDDGDIVVGVQELNTKDKKCLLEMSPEGNKKLALSFMALRYLDESLVEIKDSNLKIPVNMLRKCWYRAAFARNKFAIINKEEFSLARESIAKYGFSIDEKDLQSYLESLK